MCYKMRNVVKKKKSEDFYYEKPLLLIPIGASGICKVAVFFGYFEDI